VVEAFDTYLGVFAAVKKPTDVEEADLDQQQLQPAPAPAPNRRLNDGGWRSPLCQQ
jgi:hypothetical protein